MNVIVPPIPWHQTLEEYAEPLRRVLAELGGEPIEVWLGAHHPDVAPPPHAIIYQTEVAGSAWFTDAYRAKLARAPAVWDYSSIHRGKYDCKAWAHVPLRWNEALVTVNRSVPRDIQIGFCGSLNEHRMRVLLRGKVKAEIMPTAFGADRDRWLSRVRVMAVPHFYPGCPVEQNRIGHLLANGIAVVAENAPDQDDYPGPIYTSPDRIMDTAASLTDEDGAQQKLLFEQNGTAHNAILKAKGCI